MARTPNKRTPGSPRPVPNLTLFKLRMESGLSRAKLGELSGISEKQVGLIERGKARQSRASTLAEITAVLSVALDRPELRQEDIFPIRRRLAR